MLSPEGNAKGNSSGCCSTGNSCCCNEKKEITIDFLYLDLTVCGRCQGAENNLDSALKDVSSVLIASGFEVKVNKVNINSRDLAIKYKFLSSPTIRVNGSDIALELKESCCSECGDLCGDTVDCRVWVYEGEEYVEPPKAMIVNSILKAIYGNPSKDGADKDNEEYILPENLDNFFTALEKNN